MPEVVGAVIGAIAVICIPLVAWLSRRSTREGRLLLRVERLGSAYALMPESAEKATFHVYLTSAVRDLNAWLDPYNARRRKIVRRISGWAYAVGVIAVLLTLPIVGSGENPQLSSWFGVLIGSAIGGVTLATSFLLERRSREEQEEAEKSMEEAAAAVRMEALRRGETVEPLIAPQ